VLPVGTLVTPTLHLGCWLGTLSLSEAAGAAEREIRIYPSASTLPSLPLSPSCHLCSNSDPGAL